MERKLKGLWLATLLLSSTPVMARNNSWNDIIRSVFKHKNTINLTAGRETSPSLKLYPKVISFKGVIQLPNYVYISSGFGQVHGSAAQIIIDGQIICNYSPRSNHHSQNRTYLFNNCSDGSNTHDRINVNRKIELRLNVANSSSATLAAKIKVIQSESVQYGLVFPYLQAEEGQILMFNGEAWVASDVADLNIQGLQGEPGPIGPQGEPGPVGPQGLQGEQGITGAKGDKGDKGDPGIAGAAGATGATGPMGPQGLQGPKGDKGEPGIAGAAGATGATGPMGPQGLQGPQGPVGLQGPQGEQGVAGAQGPQGEKGDKGDPGLTRIAYLRDQKLSGSHGGTCSAGSWLPRDLNTLGGDNDFVSLSNNRFALQPGTYFIEIEAPSYLTGYHQAKLVVIETGTDVLYGTSNVTNTSPAATSYSNIMGELIVEAPSTFEIQHRCSVNKVITGFGIAVNFGTPEIYTQVKIIKKK